MSVSLPQVNFVNGKVHHGQVCELGRRTEEQIKLAEPLENGKFIVIDIGCR